MYGKVKSGDGEVDDEDAAGEGWVPLLGEEKCKADTEHVFDVREAAGDNKPLITQCRQGNLCLHISG